MSSSNNIFNNHTLFHNSNDSFPTHPPTEVPTTPGTAVLPANNQNPSKFKPNTNTSKTNTLNYASVNNTSPTNDI